MILSLGRTIFCLAGICGSLLNAQSLEEDVRDLFVSKASIEWVRTMEGTINDMHPVTMTIGYDGGAYRGIVEYSDVGQFQLQGAVRNGILTMQEIDPDGNVTGIIKGQIERDRFNGSWWSVDMTRSADIALMDKGLILLERFEPEFLILRGMAGEESMDCMLSIESPNVISGIWQRDNECVRLLGECDDFLCKEITLVVTEGDLQGALIVCTENDRGYRVTVRGTDKPISGQAEVTSVFPISRTFDADYSSLIDLAYPAIPDGAFADWMSARLSTWYDRTIRTAHQEEVGGADSRWQINASAWVDVFLYEDNMLSGVITYYNAELQQYEREAFIYDLKAEGTISISELEKREGELLRVLRSFVDSETSSLLRILSI